MGARFRSDVMRSLQSTSQSDLAGATPWSRSPYSPSEATCPERRAEVARISHPSRSDLPKRHPEVARVSMARRHEAKPGATSQSDPLRSLPKARATCRSDMPRSLRVYCWVDFLFYLRAFWSFHYARFYFLNLCFNTLEATRRRLSFDLLRNTQKLSWEVHLLDFDCYVLVLLLISYLFLYMINLKSNMGLRGIMEISE